MYLFNGQDIERWLLKTMCMSYFSTATDIGPRTHVLPPNVEQLFFGDPWPAPFGLYMPLAPTDGEPRKITTTASAEIRLHPIGNVVSGVTVNFLGFSFILIIPTTQDISDVVRGSVYRLGFINCFKDDQVIPTGFLFPETRNAPVWLSLGDPNALPPGISPPRVGVEMATKSISPFW
jgi:hypothetical protein